MENNLPALKNNEFFNPKVGLRALFSGPHRLAPYRQAIDGDNGDGDGDGDNVGDGNGDKAGGR